MRVFLSWKKTTTTTTTPTTEQTSSTPSCIDLPLLAIAEDNNNSSSSPPAQVVNSLNSSLCLNKQVLPTVHERSFKTAPTQAKTTLPLKTISENSSPLRQLEFKKETSIFIPIIEKRVSALLEKDTRESLESSLSVRQTLVPQSKTAAEQDKSPKEFSPSYPLKETDSLSSAILFNKERARKKRPLSIDSHPLSEIKLPSSTSSNVKVRRKLASENSNSINQKKPAALKKESGFTASLSAGSIMAGGSRRKVPNSETDRGHETKKYYVDNRDETPNENNPASARGDRPPSSSLSVQLGDSNTYDNDDALKFNQALKKRGLEMVEQEGDGNCLFRAVSLQVYGDASMHSEVRQKCLNFMAMDETHFSQFITDEPFREYITRKRQDGVHGNNPEIQAISELFNRPVEVFVPENGAASPLNIFHSQYKTEDTPIRLSYHDGNHYNAVIDPLVPTAGLGLGMPGLKPGLADKMQVAKAVAESDILADQMEFKRVLEESQNDELQRAIKESSYSIDNMYKNKAIELSDLDATYFELEQAALESSLNSFRTQEHERKQEAKAAGRRRRQPGHIDPVTAVSKNNGVASIPNNNSQTSIATIPPQSSSTATATITCSSSSTNSSANNHRAASAAVASSPCNTGGVARIHERRDRESSLYDNDKSSSLEEYPEIVNELVVNGFELGKVIHAYELIGDNFDSLLSFLMSTNNS